MMTPSRPKQPTAKDRLKGVLADLEMARHDRNVPGDEVGAIAENLKMALREMGVLEPNA